MDYKEINIGHIIEKGIIERGIDMSRICNFLKCTKEEIEEMYNARSIDTEMLLRWSKLLEYDFFRIYSQHMILYAPPANTNYKIPVKTVKPALPQFRKNIYTKEVIDFILEQIRLGEMTRNQIIENYNIPKTTLYKWISKYGL